jgi:hypothetical protein
MDMPLAFRSIRVKSREEFDWLIEHATHEVFRAREHWHFLVAMEAAFDEYGVEINQTPGFWGFTRRAHQDGLVLRLGRLYDPHPGPMSLGNILQTMKDGASRGGSMFPAGIANLHATALDADITSVSDQSSAVKKLHQIRNEYLAHRDARAVIKGTFASLPTLQEEDLSWLLTNALDITRRYREHLGYPILGWGSQEAEEFKHLLRLVRAGLQTWNS